MCQSIIVTYAGGSRGRSLICGKVGSENCLEEVEIWKFELSSGAEHTILCNLALSKFGHLKSTAPSACNVLCRPARQAWMSISEQLQQTNGLGSSIARISSHFGCKRHVCLQKDRETVLCRATLSVCHGSEIRTGASPAMSNPQAKSEH